MSEEYLSSTLSWQWDEMSSTMMDDSPSGKGPKDASSDSDYTAEKVLAMIALCGICILIFMLIASMFPISDCRPKWKQQTTNTIGRTLLTFFIIALALNLSSCILFVDLMWADDMRTGTYSYLKTIALYDSGKWCMSMFFVLRLYFITKDTATLNVRTWKLALLITLSTGTWLLCLWGSLGIMVGWAEANPNRSIIQYSLIALCDLIVMSIYCQRFVTVLIMQAEIQEVSGQSATATSASSEHRACPSTSEVGASEIQQKAQAEKLKVTVDQTFANLITKSTLLNLLGVLSSCMVIGYLIYLVASDGRNPYMTGALRCLDGTINTMCIFLVFRFSSKYYNFGCKCCHRGMRKCCKKIPKTVVRRRRRLQEIELVVKS